MRKCDKCKQEFDADERNDCPNCGEMIAEHFCEKCRCLYEDDRCPLCESK